MVNNSANESNLKLLWEEFIKKANEIGYCIKPDILVEFTPKNNKRHQVNGRIDLQSPSEIQLVEMGYKPAFATGSTIKRKYYKKLNERLL